MSLKVDKFMYGSRKALNKIAENADSGSLLSRELQMVPKYLECAKLSGKDIYRFNDAEIKGNFPGVLKPGKTSVQVIVGTDVQFLADEFKKLVKKE